MPYIHTRDVPSDNDAAIVAEARRRRVRPEYIQRDGHHRCPRCRRVWPLADFKPGHLTIPQERIKARCKACRFGEAAYARDEARRTGLCEGRGCYEPQHADFKCKSHYDLSEQVREQRRSRRVGA